MSARRRLLIVGAGGFAREALEAARAAAAAGTTDAEPFGFLDDDVRLQGGEIAGLRVLGPVAAVHDHPETCVVVCIGRPTAYTVRADVVARMGLDRDRMATIVHPTASIGSTCSLGVGSVVLANTVMTADVVLGEHVALMPQVVLTHDVVVEDYVTMASCVRLGGGVRVGTGAYLGSGVGVREFCRIGSRSMIGMNSLVTKDVPPERLWFGHPARDVRRAPLP